MAGLSMRDERLLHQALDAAAEELDLPLTSRQVRALARVVARLLGEQAVRRPDAMPTFQPPATSGGER
jgi:hypothetical protein